MKISVTDAEAQASAEMASDEETLQNLMTLLPKPEDLKKNGIKVVPIEFEKVTFFHLV